jgi:hypothetical protein
MMFGNSENPPRCGASIKPLFQQFMLAGISQVLWSEKFVPIKDPIESSVLNLFFWSFSQPCALNLKKVAFEHALHSICIWEAWVY